MINVTENKSWQDADVVNEIIAYYNQVAAFFGHALLAKVTKANVVCAAISNLQNKLTASAYYGRAVKPSADFGGIAAGSTYPESYGTAGLSQLYTDAGIKYGFRRCTTTPTDWTDYSDVAFSYGKAKDGDLIGPWLFKDLQILVEHIKAFKLTDILIGGGVDGQGYTREAFGGGQNSGVSQTSYATSFGDWQSIPAYPDNSMLVYSNIAAESSLGGSGYMEHYGAWQPNAFNGYAFMWVIRHGRFAIKNVDMADPLITLVPGVIADYYGRVVKPVSADTFWAYPYGAESTATKKLSTQKKANSYAPASDLLGGARITDTTAVFATRPDPDTPLAGYGVQLDDVVIRIEMDWAKL